jgi:hypothetical protein
VRGGVALGSFLVVPAAWARSSNATVRRTLVRSHFKPLVGAKLRMTGGGNHVTVVLAEVKDLAPAGSSADQFALLFKVPRRQRVSEGIRTLHHSAFGQVDLFISPVDRGVKARYFEAVINRSH